MGLTTTCALMIQTLPTRVGESSLLLMCHLFLPNAPLPPAAMVNYVLYIKADLDNVAILAPEEHARWCLDVRKQLLHCCCAVFLPYPSCHTAPAKRRRRGAQRRICLRRRRARVAGFQGVRATNSKNRVL
jgi:hypothetical protein